MLRDIPVLASADDLPFVACSQRPDTLPTQISPKASAIFVVSLWRKSFRLLAILAWIAFVRRFLPARSRAAKCVFVPGEHPGVLDLGARRKRHALFEAEVNADLGILPVGLRLVRDHEVAIPTPPRILRKRPGLDAPFDVPVLPEPHLVPVEHDDRSGEPDRLVLEGHPPEAALSSKAQPGLPRSSATIDVRVTYILDRLCRDTDQR